MVQTYGSGDGGGGDVIQGAHQPALPDRSRDLLEGGGRRGGSGQARLLSGRLHGAPDFREIFRGLVIHYAHGGKRKSPRAKIKIIWKVS
jgi:hypothetical protein